MVAHCCQGEHDIAKGCKTFRTFQVQRKQHGDLIALLSADGREVEILEVLMQARGQGIEDHRCTADSTHSAC